MSQRSYRFLFLILLLLPFASSADYMQVTLLGTGSPRPDIHRSGPAVLVEVAGKYLLFDSGRGVVKRLQQIHVPMSGIEHVFLTHLHSDHFSALDDVWLTGWIYQRKNSLNVYGPEGTEDAIQGIHQAYSYDVAIRQKNAKLNEAIVYMQANDYDPGVIYAADGVKVTAFAVNHAPVYPAFGYRIDFGERSVVISGDTTYSESLIKHAENVDVLIHEIFSAKDEILAKNPRLQKIQNYHTTPMQLSAVLNKTKPQISVLTHVILVGVSENELINELKQSYTGEVYMGEDLMRIEVGSKIKLVPFENN